MGEMDEQDKDDLSASQLLGKRIKDARTRKGLSQAQLGKDIGKDQRAIYEYELGTRKLPVTDLPKLASLLDVNILYFLEDGITQDDLDQLLLTAFHNLSSDKAKRKAIAIVTLLGKEDVDLPPRQNS